MYKTKERLPTLFCLDIACFQLNRKTFAAGTGTAGVRIIKAEALAVKPVGKIKFCSCQIEERFHVEGNPKPFIFKKLISGFFLIVEIHLV